MAVIDPKKLLPSSNKSENSEKFLVPMSSIVLKKNVAISSRLLKPEAPKDEGKGGAIVPNKLVDKIVKVESILKSNLVSQISQQNKKEREQKQKEAEEREKKLEIKPESKGKVPLPSLPRIGFLDALRNYFINTLLGFIAVKLFDMAPKLIKFLDAIKPVAGFIGEFAGNLFNGLVEFVDKGYKAYDQVQKFVKSVGGENAEKLFNDFSKNLNLVLNGAIIASMIAISTAPKGPRGGFSTPKGGTPKPVRTPTGYRAPEGVSRYLREDRVAQFGPRQKGFGERLSQRQRIAQQKLIQRPLRNLTRPARQLSGKVLNTGAGKLAGKIFGRIPIIGGLIDFAFNLAMGENPGRAAAKAVGSTLGAALGTFIPIPFAGTILGGILGDLVGGALYDTLVGSKPQKVQGKAQGGVVSSGKTPPRRAIKVQRAKPRRIVTQKTQPGKDIGGVKKIEELYGEDKPGTRSALRALKKSSEDVKRMRSLNGLSGAMFGAGIDMALGQKPDKNLSASLGSMFGAVIQTAIDSELNNTFGDITKTIAMAGGGVVPSRELKSNMSIGERIGRYISSALAVSIESSAAKILQNLNKELRLEGGPTGETPGPTGGELAEGTVARGQITIEQLVGLAKGAGFSESDAVIMAAIAMAESGGNSNAHNNKPPDNSYGLWQINMIGDLGPERLKEFGISSNDKLKDPVVNAHAAKKIKESQGFSAWSVYKNGAYRAHLNSAQRASGSPAITVYKPRTTSGEFTPLGNEVGNLQSAKQIAESMGVPLYSHVRKDDPDSYHYDGRAMDFSNDSVGKGTPQQLALAKELVKRYGSTAKEIFYTPLGFSIKNGKKVAPIASSTHYNHVHVAFEKGGKVRGLTRAILGEKGPEFVIDADSTAALEDNYPGFLDALNKAKYKDAIDVLRNFSSYTNEDMTIINRTLIIDRVG